MGEAVSVDAKQRAAAGVETISMRPLSLRMWVLTTSMPNRGRKCRKSGPCEKAGRR